MKVIRSPLIAKAVKDTDSAHTSPDRASSDLPSSRTSISSVHADSVDVALPEPSKGSMQAGIDGLVKLLVDVEKTMMDVDIGDKDLEKRLHDIREGLNDHEQAHKNGLHEIDLVYQDMILKGVIDNIKQEVEKEVEKVIDLEVERLVDEHLKKLIPDDVVDELKEKRALLDAKRIELRNIESREANSRLRKDRTASVQTMQPIYRPDGTVSSLFPKTLQDAFDLNSEDCTSLLEDYGTIVHKKCRRESILNTFLHFSGVQYQLVAQTKDDTRVEQVNHY